MPSCASPQANLTGIDGFRAPSRNHSAPNGLRPSDDRHRAVGRRRPAGDDVPGALRRRPKLRLDQPPARAAGDRIGPEGLYAYRGEPSAEQYPLVLIPPASEKTITSTLGELRTRPAALRIHPHDAKRRDLDDGDTPERRAACGAVADCCRPVRAGDRPRSEGGHRDHSGRHERSARAAGVTARVRGRGVKRVGADARPCRRRRRARSPARRSRPTAVRRRRSGIFVRRTAGAPPPAAPRPRCRRIRRAPPAADPPAGERDGARRDLRGAARRRAAVRSPAFGGRRAAERAGCCAGASPTAKTCGSSSRQR